MKVFNIVVNGGETKYYLIKFSNIDYQNPEFSEEDKVNNISVYNAILSSFETK